MKNGKYELVITPPDYPGPRYRGRYAYQHHVVWWQQTGKLRDDSNVIHHRNDNKRENEFNNLEEKSRAKHSSDHSKARGITWRALICAYCGLQFQRRNNRCPAGQERFYCCRSHQVKGQWKFLRSKSKADCLAVNQDVGGSSPPSAATGA